MHTRLSGLILNIFSTVAHTPIAGSSMYASTKAAFSLLSLGQRAELAPLNIEVATVEPGAFRTALLTQRKGSKERISDYDASVNREFLEAANKRGSG